MTQRTIWNIFGDVWDHHLDGYKFFFSILVLGGGDSCLLATLRRNIWTDFHGIFRGQNLNQGLNTQIFARLGISPAIWGFFSDGLGQNWPCFMRAPRCSPTQIHGATGVRSAAQRDHFPGAAVSLYRLWCGVHNVILALTPVERLARVCEGHDHGLCTTKRWDPDGSKSWWRHQMETFSVLLALCAGNLPVTGKCNTAVTLLLTHWSYCSVAPSHRYFNRLKGRNGKERIYDMYAIWFWNVTRTSDVQCVQTYYISVDRLNINM